MADRATIGNVEVLALVDCAPVIFPRDQFFPDVPADAWEPYKQHLTADGKVQTNFCVYVIRSQGRTVLVDTGAGPGPHEILGGIRGQLADNLAKVGVKPEDISTVVFTHLHFDHTGWNLTDGKPTFPNARYLIPRGDWEHFMKPEVRANEGSINYAAVEPLEKLGVMDLVGGDHNITSEVRTVSTPGHTPGHLSIAIDSQGQRGMIMGDVAHNPAQVQEVDWNIGADVQQDLARQTRRQMIEMLEREGLIAAFGHFPYPNIGKIVRAEGRRYWQVL